MQVPLLHHTVKRSPNFQIRFELRYATQSLTCGLHVVRRGCHLTVGGGCRLFRN
jgi:hypothetical protein